MMSIRAMSSIRRSILAAASLFVLAASPACDRQNSNEASPHTLRSATTKESLALRLNLPPDLAEDRIQAIAQALEKAAGPGVEQARIWIEKRDLAGADAIAHFELGGSQLAAKESIIADVCTQFPELDAANFSLDAGDQPPRHTFIHNIDEADPELAKQEIIDQLRADGVNGDIHVEVGDAQQGRKIEIKIAK
jgi:hypothetical protein